MKATIIRKSLSFSIFSKYRAEMMGLAIFTVMFRHLLGWLDAGYIEGLYGGVIGFFNGLLFTEGFLLLSGMGLYYSFSKNSNIKVFYIKRIKRLYIPFIIMTFAFYVWSDLILEGGVI